MGPLHFEQRVNGCGAGPRSLKERRASSICSSSVSASIRTAATPRLPASPRSFVTIRRPCCRAAAISSSSLPSRQNSVSYPASRSHRARLPSIASTIRGGALPAGHALCGTTDSCDTMASMLEPALLTLGLAFLLPIGYALIGASGLPRERASHGAVSLFVALGLAVAGYVITGFALQYGGVGLAHDAPGYDGLIWEWSALGVTWGPGWGMAGLAGWLLSGPATTAAARDLALANLPWVVTAALIPVMAFRGRIPGWATALAGLLVGGLIYPVASNWVWGGGWLANLGSNLGLSHGFVDAAGAGTVHLLGASVALAGVLVFLPAATASRARRDRAAPRGHFSAARPARGGVPLRRSARLDFVQSAAARRDRNPRDVP